MVGPCGPNVVDGPLSWLSTGPVIFGQGFLATFASQSLEQSKSLLQISYPAFNGLTKAKRQSVFHRNLGGDVGRHRFPSPRTLTKMALVPEGTRAIHLSYGAGDGNRTRVISLEGWGSTIELRPQDMVGTTGFEPATSCSQSRRATKLRHVPKVLSS